MAPYRIVLLSPDETANEERTIECAHDDEAIDAAGWLDHPHAIEVWQQARRPRRDYPGGRRALTSTGRWPRAGLRARTREGRRKSAQNPKIRAS